MNHLLAIFIPLFLVACVLQDQGSNEGNERLDDPAEDIIASEDDKVRMTSEPGAGLEKAKASKVQLKNYDSSTSDLNHQSEIEAKRAKRDHAEWQRKKKKKLNRKMKKVKNTN